MIRGAESSSSSFWWSVWAGVAARGWWVFVGQKLASLASLNRFFFFPEMTAENNLCDEVSDIKHPLIHLLLSCWWSLGWSRAEERKGGRRSPLLHPPLQFSSLYSELVCSDVSTSFISFKLLLEEPELQAFESKEALISSKPPRPAAMLENPKPATASKHGAAKVSAERLCCLTLDLLDLVFCSLCHVMDWGVAEGEPVPGSEGETTWRVVLALKACWVSFWGTTAQPSSEFKCRKCPPEVEPSGELGVTAAVTEPLLLNV